MSGRGRGRGRAGRGRSSGGRGGRGRSGSYSTSSKTPEYKFAPHSSNKPQTATYATIKDHIVQYVQKTYKDGMDVAASLRDMQKKDLKSLKPGRKISIEADAATKKIEQAGFDIEFNAELSRWMDRRDNLETNLGKAHALIIANCCSKTMQNRVEEHPDCESKIRDNPIELLEAIKSLMHDPIRARYPFVSVTDALVRLTNLRQYDNELLLDYIKRFKQQRDVLKSNIGTQMFDEFIENTEEYRNETDTTKQQELKDNAFEQWCAFLLIRNSDQAKYGSLQKGLVSQF